MKRTQLLSKALMTILLFMVPGALYSMEPEEVSLKSVFIKNSTSSNLEMKVYSIQGNQWHTTISSDNPYHLTTNELKNMVTCFVRYAGLTSYFVRYDFVPLDINNLILTSKNVLAKPNAQGFERDIYWVIDDASGPLKAHVESVQRKK